MGIHEYDVNALEGANFMMKLKMNTIVSNIIRLIRSILIAVICFTLIRQSSGGYCVCVFSLSLLHQQKIHTKSTIFLLYSVCAIPSSNKQIKQH